MYTEGLEGLLQVMKVHQGELEGNYQNWEQSGKKLPFEGWGRSPVESEILLCYGIFNLHQSDTYT